jgi:hypothetical protein
MDTGLISLKPTEYERGVDNYRKNALLPGQSKVEVAPLFEIGDPVVVEWRALTIAYLDLIADNVRESLRMSRQLLSLSQLMEAGTWSVSLKKEMYGVKSYQWLIFFFHPIGG